ncbi:hypothetical protein [Polyangium spumosum]|uniref:Uncharacterized protein n=1 Tax=Polyangium spumosum TaxID=889282 RepID=A0A6N7Q2B1_9BACT|nr:hypothetical protein [Polyangium spumosum]MRG98413.1 hypothetical protein [Polyangium spumosum]
MKSHRISAKDVFEAFAEHLTKEREKLACIATFGGSFEGWLKMELAYWCSRKWNRSPWRGEGRGRTWGDVGIEYHAPLYERKPQAGGPTKCVDLWVSAEPNSDDTIYVELKVAIQAGTPHKQFWSWRSDFEQLCSISSEVSPVGLTSIIVGVGFDATTWIRLVEMATQGMASTNLLHRTVDIGTATPVHLQALLYQRT